MNMPVRSRLEGGDDVMNMPVRSRLEGGDDVMNMPVRSRLDGADDVICLSDQGWTVVMMLYACQVKVGGW